MAREKGMGSLQQEKSGRWTMRVCIDGKRYSRSTRTRDRDQAERVLQRFLAPLGLGERRLPLADVWNAYVVSPNRSELAPATLNAKRVTWMHFAKWMERNYLPVRNLAGVTAEMIAEYLALLRANLCGSSYNGRVCVLREIFRTLAAKAGLEDDPWEGVRLRPDDSHSRRELTMEELHRLISAAKSVPSASRRPALASGEAVAAPVAEDGDGTVSGLIVRLLVLPGHADEAIENLAWLATELSNEIPVSIMSQFTPAYKALETPPFNRGVTEEEYASVTEAAADFGFENGWIQGFGAADPKLALLGENMSSDHGVVR